MARQFDNELLMKENRQKLNREQLTFLVFIQDEPSNIEIKLVGKTWLSESTKKEILGMMKKRSDSFTILRYNDLVKQFKS